MLLALPPMSRTGRPPAGRADRLRHIRCAGLLLGDVYSAKVLAQAEGVSVKTIYNWRDLALEYDDPEAEGLRVKLCRRRRRSPD
jgi:hypothetical protein